MKIPSVKQIKHLRKSDTVPPGWFSREQCQKEWNVNQSNAAVLLRTAMTAGKCEMKKFLIHTESRGLFPTPFYKFK